MEQLSKAHRAQPFCPFTLHMADGRSLRVAHPENLAYNPPGRTAVLALPSDDHEIIDLLLVTSMTVGAGEPPTTNGDAEFAAAH